MSLEQLGKIGEAVGGRATNAGPAAAAPSSPAAWGFGILYVQRTRRLAAPLRRRLLLIYYLGPPALLVLLRAMAPVAYQREAPLVPLWAFGVFSILFLVPVTMKFPGRSG